MNENEISKVVVDAAVKITESEIQNHGGDGYLWNQGPWDR
jgi:hypothetical protein